MRLYGNGGSSLSREQPHLKLLHGLPGQAFTKGLWAISVPLLMQLCRLNGSKAQHTANLICRQNYVCLGLVLGQSAVRAGMTKNQYQQ